MQIEALRHFVILANAGSFYQASKLSDLSVQGYAKMLDSLERNLGVKLAARSRSGIHLTRAGKIFLNYANCTLEDLEITIKEMQVASDEEAAGTKKPTIYLTHYGMQVSSYLGYLYEALSNYDFHEEDFNKVLARASAHNPHDVFCAEVFSESAFAEMERNHVVLEPIFQSRLGIAVSDEAPLAQSRTFCLQDLKDVSLSHYSQREWTRLIENTFGRLTLDNIRSDSTAVPILFDQIKSDTSRGFLLDSFGFYAVQHSQHYDASGLVFVPFDDDSATFSLGVLHRDDQTLPHRVQEFIKAQRDFTRSHAADYLEMFASFE